LPVLTALKLADVTLERVWGCWWQRQCIYHMNHADAEAIIAYLKSLPAPVH
jgi:hypothetical protein